MILTACLMIAATPAPGTTATPSDARVSELVQRLETAEERFRQSMADLASLDVTESSMHLFEELRRVEREVQGMLLGDITPNLRREIEVDLLEQLDYLHYLMEQHVCVAVGANRLSALLAEMREHLAAEAPEKALAAYDALLADATHREGAPYLMRRMLEEIVTERRSALDALQRSEKRPARPVVPLARPR